MTNYPDEYAKAIAANAELANINADLAIDNINLAAKVERLEELQEASIELYCGVINKAEWRIAVRNSPKGQELIALAEEEI